MEEVLFPSLCLLDCLDYKYQVHPYVKEKWKSRPLQRYASCAVALPPGLEVTVSHCFQKCNKAVVATPGNAIHHLMDDDPLNFTKN